ncbi:MAG: hypothetical protein ACOYLB_07285 [Phototrophicaceae bacterium]
MGGLEIGDILSKLSIYSEPGLLPNILLYIAFFLNLIAFFMQSDKQLMATLALGLTLALIVIAKLVILDYDNLLYFVVNVGICLIPLVVTGMTKAKKSQPLTLFAALIGGAFAILFWLTLQRGDGSIWG